jgi:divalent metal cation (Fe/Co/Zn/Cd) transporter
MKDWRTIYWTIFNILGRIVGLLFFVGGFTIGIYGLISLRNHQMPTTDAWIMIISSCIVAIFGILLVIARSYWPENIKKTNDDSKDLSNE